MRAVFALTSMGFVRDGDGREITEDSPLTAIAEGEPVRVRMSPAWIRVDARYGSVYQRRAVPARREGSDLVLDVGTLDNGDVLLME